MSGQFISLQASRKDRLTNLTNRFKTSYTISVNALNKGKGSQEVEGPGKEKLENSKEIQIRFHFWKAVKDKDDNFTTLRPVKKLR
jgi:hypothetical protein